MKIRQGFVSNSSSSSYVIVVNKKYHEDELYEEVFKVLLDVISCYHDTEYEESGFDKAQMAENLQKYEYWQFSIPYGDSDDKMPEKLEKVKYVERVIDEN